LAPCPHTGPCPLRAAGDRPCFSEWAWTPPREVRALADRAGLDRTSLKAAWLAFGNASPALSAHPAELLPVSLHGRVVSEPMRNKAGRIRVIVCAASGLVTLSAPQNSPEARALGFFDLSRGCLIEAEGLEVRQNAVSLHVGIAAESRLRVILRPPRY
ncbi:MAG: hypothetical protein N3A02_01695, partial [Rectinema sp.]|nr:hypothetical protein [Rectinema sp.]